MVHAIKMGWMKRSTEKKEKEDDEPKYHMLWKDDEEVGVISSLVLTSSFIEAVFKKVLKRK